MQIVFEIRFQLDQCNFDPPSIKMWVRYMDQLSKILHNHGKKKNPQNRDIMYTSNNMYTYS